MLLCTYSEGRKPLPEAAFLLSNKRQHMSVRVMSKIFDHSFNRVEIQGKKTICVMPYVQKLVMLALADHANDEGESAYPGRETIRHKTNLSSGTLNYCIRALKASGYIIKGRRSKYNTITYSLDLSKLETSTVEETQKIETSTVEVSKPQLLRKLTSTVEVNPSLHQLNHPSHTEKEPCGVFDVIDMVKRVTGVNPKVRLHEYICDTLGAWPDEQKLKEVFTAWIARDYNPKNIAGILQWYKDGIPQQGNRYAPGKNANSVGRNLPPITSTDGGFYA
jgi:biotin operon repressor